MHRHYIFTDKRESKKGILSAVLGAMSLISVFLTVRRSLRPEITFFVYFSSIAFLIAPSSSSYVSYAGICG